jgi:predicted amidohydrolase YtcJ
MRRAIGADRSAWSHRGRSLLEAGLPLAFSSDRLVAPGAPLGGIQAFAERLTEVARQLADMVFLEEHPADVAVEEIGSIAVLATVMGGVFTHRQDGW